MDMLEKLAAISEGIIGALRHPLKMAKRQWGQKLITYKDPLSLWWTNLYWGRAYLILLLRCLPEVEIFLIPWGKEERGFKLLRGLQRYRADTIKKGKRCLDFTLYIEPEITQRDLCGVLSIFLLQAGVQDDGLYEFLKIYLRRFKIDPEKINEFINTIRVKFHPWHFKEILKYLKKVAKGYKKESEISRVAKMIGVHPSTLYRQIKSGKIRAEWRDNYLSIPEEEISILKERQAWKETYKPFAERIGIKPESVRRWVRRLKNKGQSMERIKEMSKEKVQEVKIKRNSEVIPGT